MIRIPADRRWTVTNSGDVFGTLNSTYNMHFDKEGYATVTPKAVTIYSTSDDADFKLPLSVFPYNNEYFVLTADFPFSISSGLSFTKLTGAPNDISSGNSDATEWQSRAYITTNDDLIYWDGASYSTGLKTLTSGKPHPTEVFKSGNQLAIGNGNTVLLINTSHTTLYTLTIPSDYEVTCLKYFQNNLYVGTRAVNGDEALLFVWNGAGSSAQAGYGVGAAHIYAIEEYQSSVALITSEGQLLRFTGGGFQTLANLPVYHSQYRWASGTERVHRRGMKVDGDILYINLQGMVTKTDAFGYLHGQPSGVWCYDPNVGLYCRHLSTTDTLRTIAVSSRSGNTLTLASSILAETGEPIYMTENGSLTGVSDSTLYYLVKVSDTEVQLATTRANALSGNILTLGGTAGSASVRVVGYTDYGYHYESGIPGALGLLRVDPQSPSIFIPILRSMIVWGVDLGGTEYLNTLSLGSNIGGITTNKVWSSQVSDLFQKAYVKYFGIRGADDSVTVKVRTADSLGLPTEPITGTWSTNRVLGTGSDMIRQVAEGNGVRVLSGAGCAQTASVQSVDGQEVALDETYAVTSAAAATFVVDEFQKAGRFTSGLYDSALLSKASSWAQLYLEVRGIDAGIEEIQLVNDTHKQSA